MSKPLIVGFGEALVDVLPTGEVIGGAPLNFAIRAAELGARANCETALVTRIGADARGEKILERLNAAELDTSCIQVDSRLQTGFVDVVFEGGQPSYVIGEGVAWDAIQFDELLADVARRCATVCFGTLVQRHSQSRETLLRFLDAAPQAHKILDINFRNPLPTIETIESSMRAADVLKCNDEELAVLAETLRLDERESLTEIGVELQAKFDLQAIFWTRGPKGCCWQVGATQVDGEVPHLPRVENADSVGAGDATSGALAVGLTLGWAPERMVRAANLCGAFAASQRGPTVPMPPDILQRVLSN